MAGINPVNHLLGQGRKMNYVMSHTDAAINLPNRESSGTSRHPANQFLLLDSADRLVVSSVNLPTQVGAIQIVEQQPWNNFQLQKPQSLMEAFAKRIAIVEVRFPWYIPNVNSYNNSFTIYTKDASSNLVLFTFTIPIGFYIPSALVTTVQGVLTSSASYSTSGKAFLHAMTFAYNASTFTYSFTMGGTTAGDYAIFGFAPGVQGGGSAATYTRFQSQANFFNLIGFPFAYSFVSFFGGGNQVLKGLPTETLYTEYVDITSDKAHEFTNLRDGNSGPTATTSLCRIYVCDNISIPESVYVGQVPQVIYRQFRHAKFIKWNPESVISWLDIQVRDSWGNLVFTLPDIVVPTTAGTKSVFQPYPDFQLTVLASED